MDIPANPLPLLAAASRTYFEDYVPHGRSPDLTAAFVEEIRRIRSEIRREEGGGGMCHLVTEWLSTMPGVTRVAVTYLSRGGEVVCCGHYAVILADGAILDPTADQFGEGHDVRILRVDDPEYGRYRPEFYEDWHPRHPDAEARLDAWLPFVPAGKEFDAEVQDELDGERGKAWHLDDPATYLAYLDEQVALATHPTDCGAIYARWAEDIRASHPGVGSTIPSP